ncbi:MAG TPA: NlpC/P60 family protein [Gaiellaceae bacterium]|nr:NlpC/P60 family protein [Gaiellaceae bacterium]
MLPLALAVLALAVPKPGQHATIDVAVATLWKEPAAARPLDAPSLRNPVDLNAWNRNLATTAARIWLDDHVQTQALYGQDVTVLAVRGGWARVAVTDEPDPQDPRGYPGWLPVRQLATGFDAGGRSLVVTAKRATLRVAGRVLQLSYGTRLPLVRRLAGGVAIVRTPDGEGRLAGSATAAPSPPTGAAVVSSARRFLGLRYLWGGLSAWGFDCSGLVWDVFRAHGTTVPRDADPQFRHGRAVAASALRPGDLLFYGTPSYVHHVAIYAGGGRMIESPDSAHAVRLVPVRWTGFAGARRYTRG